MTILITEAKGSSRLRMKSLTRESRLAGRNKKAHRFSGGRLARGNLSAVGTGEDQAFLRSSVVPAGLGLKYTVFPALKGWAKLFRPPRRARVVPGSASTRVPHAKSRSLRSD